LVNNWLRYVLHFVNDYEEEEEEQRIEVEGKLQQK
jgi:hypothetical protein